MYDPPTLQHLVRLLKDLLSQANGRKKISNNKLAQALNKNEEPFTVRMIQGWDSGKVQAVKEKAIQLALYLAARELLLGANPSTLQTLLALEDDTQTRREEAVHAYLTAVFPDVRLPKATEPALPTGAGLPTGTIIHSESITLPPHPFTGLTKTVDLAAKALLPRNAETDPDLAHHYFSIPSTSVKIPYKELIGNGSKDIREYPIHSIECSVSSERSDLEARISAFYDDYYPDKRFDLGIAAYTQREKDLGYTKHPPKLWLRSFIECDDNTLRMTFGQVDYLAHRLYREVLSDTLISPNHERETFLQVLNSGDGNAIRLGNAPWTFCGIGVWMLTGDGYLLLSHRQKVGEIPGKISYSSSGAVNFTEDDPLMDALRKEIHEELGIPLNQTKTLPLTLISMGIDLERFLVQFSFVCRSSYSAAYFLERRSEATSAAEQNMLLVPIKDGNALKSLLLSAAFEPGAAVSLHRLLQKGLLG